MKERARTREDKEDRRLAILAAAREVWAVSTFAVLTMAQVGDRAKLAKGTLYLYFPTKEALLLGVLEADLGRWLSEVGRRLEEPSAIWTPDTVADLLASTLLADLAMVRLLVILGTILEHNVPQARILHFKDWLLVRMQEAGRQFERRLSFLGGGEGLRLLLHLHALVTGLGQIAQPAPAVARVLAQPRFEPFRIDFGEELRAMLQALLRGLADDRHTKKRRAR
jgi:AcrR family transcriptional regulator